MSARKKLDNFLIIMYQMLALFHYNFVKLFLSEIERHYKKPKVVSRNQILHKR